MVLVFASSIFVVVNDVASNVDMTDCDYIGSES